MKATTETTMIQAGSLQELVRRLFCKHHTWTKRPDLNVLYACGEDGAFGWSCARCGKTALTDDDVPPNDPSSAMKAGQETNK
jgi:hypothetical protein